MPTWYLVKLPDGTVEWTETPPLYTGYIELAYVYSDKKPETNRLTQIYQDRVVPKDKVHPF